MQTKAEVEFMETLDPENWETMRKLGYKMVDDAIDYLRSVGERPVWQPVPDEIAETFAQSVPLEPAAPEVVYEEFVETILPYPLGNIHPRFWGWYMGNGTIMGAMAEFMAGVMNTNVGGGHNAAIMVEKQVIEWIKTVANFPATGSGLLVSGGSMANLVGLTVARNKIAGFDVRNKGIQGNHRKLTVYASTEVHSSNQKAVELLGIGNDCLRKIPVNRDYTMNLESLRATVGRDKKDGFQPICIIATSGTVNTGAIDDLNAIADFCRDENIWFHIDGAIGAIAMLSDKVRPQLSGIERADSLALDLHKWMHIPFDTGCILVKDAEAHKDTFSLVPEYLEKGEHGIAAGTNWFSEYGIQLSRSFRALKIWMTMKEHGTKKLGRMITRNVEQAHYLGERIANSDVLELVAPIGMDIVCYRYNPGDRAPQSLNDLNRAILVELQENGIAAPSYTTLNGVYCIRVAIANHRSRLEDFDVLVAETIRIGEQLDIE